MQIQMLSVEFEDKTKNSKLLKGKFPIANKEHLNQLNQLPLSKHTVTVWDKDYLTPRDVGFFLMFLKVTNILVILYQHKNYLIILF